MELLRVLVHFAIAFFNRCRELLGSQLDRLLLHRWWNPWWTFFGAIITIIIYLFPGNIKQAPPPGNTNTIDRLQESLEEEGKQNPQSGKCESYTQVRVSCKNANVYGGLATISILPCDMVRIDEISISDASGHDYSVDPNSTIFQVPPGNNDESSNTTIRYTSLSDGIQRVKSILVNKFGRCPLM